MTTFSRVLALALLLATPRGASADDRFAAEVTRAVGALLDGQSSLAVQALGRAREARAVPELDALVALAALAGGDPGQAAALLGDAVRRGSTEPLVFYWSGRVALQQGRPAEALTHFARALAVGGDRPELRMGHGLAALAAGQPRVAVASLLEVARAEPNLLHPGLYPTLDHGAAALWEALLRPARSDLQRRAAAALLWRAGRALPALERLEALLDGSPEDADALQLSARCLAFLGRRTEALQRAQRAVALAPGLAAAQAVLGELLLGAGRAAEAVTPLRRAADALPADADVLARLGLACGLSEQPDCAERFLGYALARDPNQPEARLALALLLQQKGEAAEAAKMANAALAMSPGNPKYHEAAAHLAGLRGETAEARRHLAGARAARRWQSRVESVERDALQVMDALLGLADRLRKGGACDGACPATLRELPDPARRFVLAHLALRAGRTAEARRHLAPLATRLHPKKLLGDDPTVILLLGKAPNGKPLRLQRVFPLVHPANLK